MINEDKTFEKFGYRSNELSRCSNKKVVCICDCCEDERESRFYQIRDLCHTCGNATPETRDRRSKSAIKHRNKPGVREEMSDRLTQWYIDHPEARKLAKLKADEQWDSQDARNAQSGRITNSPAMKIEHERQVGGMDIVNHHYIYDHSDLSLNTVQMTRSDHARLHHLLNRLGFKIPHINDNQMEVL